jgi:hypothetical protein
VEETTMRNVKVLLLVAGVAFLASVLAARATLVLTRRPLPATDPNIGDTEAKVRSRMGEPTRTMGPGGGVWVYLDRPSPQGTTKTAVSFRDGRVHGVSVALQE